MAMTQDDIRGHYETEWASADARNATAMSYSDPVERAVAEPIYLRLLDDLGVGPGGRVLDVGCGSGRWVRFLHGALRPSRLVGTDFASSAVELLRGTAIGDEAGVSFEQADITEPGLDLGERFDLINIANVLFHVPEAEKFQAALDNLRRHLAPGGRVLVTDYLPRTSLRTEWMLVRSRYEWEQRLAEAGLRIAGIRPICVFSNDPMGIDGLESGARGHFNRVRARSRELLKAAEDENVRAFIEEMLCDIERAVLTFCEERVAPIDMPSQKLIALAE